MIKRLTSCLLFLLLCNVSGLEKEMPIKLSSKLTSILQKKCVDCHNSKKKKGKFDLEDLMKNPHSPEKWMNIFDEISEGNMPPEDEPQLSETEKQTVLNSLPNFQAKEVSRVLTPSEINNSLIDFFKADKSTFNAETLLAVNYSDESYHTQQKDVISPYYLDDLYKTLDSSINTLVHARKLPEPVTIKGVLAQTGHISRKVTMKVDGKKVTGGDLRWRWKGGGGPFDFQYPGQAATGTLPPGTYELSFDLSTPNYNKPFKDPKLAAPYGFLKTDKYFKVAFYAKPAKGDLLGSTKMIKVINAPLELKRVTVNIEITRPSKLSAGLIKGPSGGSFKYLVDKIYGKKGMWKNEQYPLPCVRFLNVEIRGPISLVKADTTIFGDSLTPENVKSKLRSIQQKNFLPVDEDHYKSFEYFRQSGFTYENAYRKSILMFFMSSKFMNIKQDGDYADKMRFASYSLLKSPPEEQFNKAYQNFDKTRNGRAFAEWMVKSPNFSRFVESFSKQWLHMDHMKNNPPGKAAFPEFYVQKLGENFPEETLAFMKYIFLSNRPVDELVTADYSFLNPSLHSFYKTGASEAKALARKAVYETLGEYSKYQFKDSNRGGILTQGTFLTVNSNGVEELPIRRAVWILENILNRRVPEPSISVDLVQFEAAKELSFNKRLELHRNNKECSSCHKRMDPLAVVMNSFDTIGQFKLTPEQKVKKPGKEKNMKKIAHLLSRPTLENFSESFEGHKIESVKDFKTYLKTQKKKIAQAFLTNVLEFTLGRDLLVSDSQRIDSIIEKNLKTGLRTVDLYGSFLEEYF